MKTVLLIVMFLGLAACSSPKRIIIDEQGVDMAQYQQDLQACQVYAKEVDAGKQAASGAVGSAVVGAAIGAIVGDSRTVAKAAGVGGVTGAVRGAGKAGQEKSQIVRNCLRGRGYKVLN